MPDLAYDILFDADRRLLARVEPAASWRERWLGYFKAVPAPVAVVLHTPVSGQGGCAGAATNIEGEP